MTAVTYSNLFSASRSNVKTIIEDNVSDPISGSAQSRKWIYSRVPDTKDAGFKGFPIIIIHPAEFEPQEGGSIDGKSKFVNWNIEIEVITSDRGHGSKDGQGLSHMDTISNSILEELLDMTNRNSLSSDNMKFSRPTPTSVSTEELNDELIYRRTIVATFMNRIQVSA